MCAMKTKASVRKTRNHFRLGSTTDSRDPPLPRPELGVEQTKSGPKRTSPDKDHYALPGAVVPHRKTCGNCSRNSRFRRIDGGFPPLLNTFGPAGSVAGSVRPFNAPRGSPNALVLLHRSVLASARGYASPAGTRFPSVKSSTRASTASTMATRLPSSSGLSRTHFTNASASSA